MARQRVHHGWPPGRGAFTLVELLLASTITALTAAAGAALVFAIANASQETADIRQTISAGHYALNRIGKSIREARVVGQVSSNAMTLWTQDKNNNDEVNLDEIALIRYDSVTKQIVYQYLATAGAGAVVVNYSNLTSCNALATLMGAGVQSVVWAENVEAFDLAASPNLTEGRVVNAHFTIGAGADAVDFRVAASPKGSGDYLFLADTRIEQTSPTGRVRRKYFSTWEGWVDYGGSIHRIYGTPLAGQGGVAGG